uniref:Uncharacterized protein n=1 Tax=Calidris pygmaea TaxID=425635 RepID=A0A8C3PI20_9CHAR
MGKVNKNFWGHCYECSSDHLDLRSYVKQCISIQNPNFSGHQDFLKKEDYPDFQNSAWQCITLYEKEELQGQILELTDDCPSNLQHPREYRRFLDWGAVNAKIVSAEAG